MTSLFRSIAAVALGALREIFDENAYSRFLRRENLPSSRDAYRLFLEERAVQREHRLRCC